MSTSTGSASSAWLSIGSASSKPTTVPVSATCRNSAATSSPSSSWMPPYWSLTATTRAPWPARIAAACEPTLPKPWTATDASDSSRPASASAALVVWTTPCDVAVVRPSEPPTGMGLPVTTPGIV
ncbi:hypothetical protein D3C74_345190 [compost metagenome]